MARNNKEVTQAIKDDLLRYIAGIQDSLDHNVATIIGTAVVAAMKDMISKGISPIEGVGRFPAYISQAGGKQMRQALRGNGRKRQPNARQIRSSLKKGYPYSVQKKFPSKRVRPVNLFLSGDFLNALIFEVTGAAGGFGIEVGFFDKNQAVKEQGHREQAKGQGFRPTIPINTEEFAVKIQRAIIQIVNDTLDRAAV